MAGPAEGARRCFVRPASCFRPSQRETAAVARSPPGPSTQAALNRRPARAATGVSPPPSAVFDRRASCSGKERSAPRGAGHPMGTVRTRCPKRSNFESYRGTAMLGRERETPRSAECCTRRWPGLLTRESPPHWAHCPCIRCHVAPFSYDCEKGMFRAPGAENHHPMAQASVGRMHSSRHGTCSSSPCRRQEPL